MAVISKGLRNLLEPLFGKRGYLEINKIIRSQDSDLQAWSREEADNFLYNHARCTSCGYMWIQLAFHGNDCVRCGKNSVDFAYREPSEKIYQRT